MMDELTSDLINIRRTGCSTHPDPKVRAARQAVVRDSADRSQAIPPLSPDQLGAIAAMLREGR